MRRVPPRSSRPAAGHGVYRAITVMRNRRQAFAIVAVAVSAATALSTGRLAGMSLGARAVLSFAKTLRVA
jgi:hypothetical protein